MNLMKYLSIVGVAALLSLCLAGCQSSASSSSASASSASSASASQASASAEAASQAASESASAAASSAAAQSAESVEADIDTYENEYFGLAFTLPEGWQFAEMDSLNELYASAPSESITTKVDMVAQSPDGSVTATVILEEATEETAGLSAEEMLAEKTDEIVSTVTGGASVEVNDAEISFDGVRDAIPATVAVISNNGASMYIGQAVVENEGVFFEILVLGSSEQGTLDALGNFSAIL